MLSPLQSDVCNAGQLIMGDATYNHIYNATDSTGSVTQRLPPENAAHVELDQGAPEVMHDDTRARSSSPEAEAEDGLDALHNAIVSNTDGSVSMNAVGTPTGMPPMRVSNSVWPECVCPECLCSAP